MTERNDASRCTIDFLKKPVSAQLNDGVTTHVIPGRPQRYLMVSLGNGTVNIGWASGPDGTPDEPLELPARGSRIEAYVDLHTEGRAVIEAWNGFADTDRTSFEIGFSHE